jgi:hypothetical protein
MLYIDSLTKDDLELLLSNHNGSCMSVFMPTHVGPDSRQDPIRLKNILYQAEHKLIESGVFSQKLKDTLFKPAVNLIEQEQFWRHHSQGLALFISQDIFEYFRLPISFEELVVINNRFHIKPLFPMFRGDGKFYILSLSKNQVKLFQCTKYSIREVHLAQLPKSLEESLYNDEPGRPTLSHSQTPPGGTGGQTGIAHGQILGEDADYENKETLQYFFQINDALSEILHKQNSPLIIACVERNFPIYRDANTYPHLVDKFIHGNPDLLSEQQLHEVGVEIVEPIFKQAEKMAYDKYNELQSRNKETKLTSHELEDIIPGAFYGQIDTLFIAANEQQWGSFDPDTNIIYLNREEKLGNQDLLDFAAIQTFLHGGKVYVLPKEQVPGKHKMAALFRYPSVIRTMLAIR